MIKKILHLKLKFLAKMVLAKYKPDIIGVTGSVGKTGAKEAIVQVLSQKFNVRGSKKNYNNEIGLPLSILGLESPGKSIIGWFLVLWRASMLWLFKDKNYPKILVLEMGVDRPGDMEYLTKIAKPYIGVLTRIGETHLEFFGSVEKIEKEKKILIDNLKKDGIAILNNDDERIKNIKTENKIISYGLKEGADVLAKDLKFNFEGNKDVENLKGVSFVLSANEKQEKIILPNVIGYSAIYASLAGASVGLAYNINFPEIAKALSSLKTPRGRMNLIKGIKHSMIIDDTYNSSPQSAQMALDWIKQIKLKEGARKIAILGDMLELGSYSEEGHRLIGRVAYQAGIDKLIVVGERAQDIGRGAEDAGMKRDNIFHFDNADEAKKFVEDRILEGDLILIKGSQGMRMEKIVKEIMADPISAEFLLVRQGREWKDK